MNSELVRAFIEETNRLRAKLPADADVYAFDRRRYYELRRQEPEIARFLKTTTGENNRARYLGLNGRVTCEEWLLLCIQYGNVCLVCGGSGPLGMDHVIPLARGGTHTIDNVQPMCWPCNLYKRCRIVDYRIDDINSLLATVDLLSRQLAVARKRKALTYSEALALFQRLDHLTREAEIAMCETPDYPDEDGGDEPIII